MSDRAFPKEQLEDDDRVVLLIDGESLFQAAAELNFEVDYARLLEYFSRQYNLLRAYFYTGISPGNHRQQAFLKWMQRNGYRVISKELVAQKDGRRSADLSVEIATDILRLVEQVSCMVVITHNSNLAYAMEIASQKGIRFELVGLDAELNSQLSNICDNLISINQIQTEIQKQTS